MPTFDSLKDLLTEVAKACDYSLKPWKHSVVDNSKNLSTLPKNNFIDLSLTIECRSKEGKRFPENDLEVEIYKSGVDLCITLSWISFPEKPILWHGKHSVWMDSSSGSRSLPPDGGASLEALARRLRASFV